jgi:hypothetical protein
MKNSRSDRHGHDPSARTSIGEMMRKGQDSEAAGPPSAGSLPTDAEIEVAAERLGLNWLQGSSRPYGAGASQIVQSLAHGRAHAVSVEIKRPPRRRADPR